MSDQSRWRPKIKVLFTYGTDWAIRENYVVGSNCVVIHQCSKRNQYCTYKVEEDTICINCRCNVPIKVQEAWELYNMSQPKRGEASDQS